MTQCEYETYPIYDLKYEYDRMSREKESEESLRSLRSLMIKAKRMNSIFDECCFTKEFVRNYLEGRLPIDALSELTLQTMRDGTIDDTRTYSFSHSQLLYSLRTLRSTWDHIGWVSYDERLKKKAEDLEKLFEDSEKEKERLLDLFYDEYTQLNTFCKELLVKKTI